MEHRRPKAGDVPHEGLLKSKGAGFGVVGFWGFWGFGVLGFRCLGVWVFRCLGVQVFRELGGLGFGMKPVLDESVVERNHFGMKVSLDETVFG